MSHQSVLFARVRFRVVFGPVDPVKRNYGVMCYGLYSAEGAHRAGQTEPRVISVNGRFRGALELFLVKSYTRFPCTPRY